MVITLEPRQDRNEASKRRGEADRGSIFAASRRGFCLETCRSLVINLLEQCYCADQSINQTNGNLVLTTTTNNNLFTNKHII